MEFMEVFWPCFFALWAICSIIVIGIIAIESNSEQNHESGLFIDFLMVLGGPFTLGLTLGAEPE